MQAILISDILVGVEQLGFTNMENAMNELLSRRFGSLTAELS